MFITNISATFHAHTHDSDGNVFRIWPSDVISLTAGGETTCALAPLTRHRLGCVVNPPPRPDLVEVKHLDLLFLSVRLDTSGRSNFPLKEVE